MSYLDDEITMKDEDIFMNAELEDDADLGDDDLDLGDDGLDLDDETEDDALVADEELM